MIFDYFSTPILVEEYPELVEDLISLTDPIVEKSKRDLSEELQERNKSLNMTGDHGFVYHKIALTIWNQLFGPLKSFIIRA